MKTFEVQMKISMKYVAYGLIGNEPALLQVMNGLPPKRR